MAIAGIIAEYNPFHRGHQWQIQQTRSVLGSDTAIVAVMSGNFVQRGDFAIFPKHARAEAAVRGGVDLVLELPTPWGAATAECFAGGGVSQLAATGVVTHLVFGSEQGELAPLRKTADALESEQYPAALRGALSQGMTFAAAREQAVRERIGEDASVLSLPNNALAVEYLRALGAIGGGMEPVTFRRIGSAHDSGEVGEYASASAIREQLFNDGEWRSLLPETTVAVIERERSAGRGPVTMQNCERAVLSQLRKMDEEEFASFDGGGEGLYHRFYDAVQRGTSVEEILAAAKTKRYPLARLRRMLLHSYLDVRQAAKESVPPYLRVLAANERGRELLRQMRKSASLPVITQPAEVRKLGGEVERLFEQEARCTDLYTLAFPDLRRAEPGLEYRINPVML